MSFVYNRTIRFQDTDAAGVVYFANVLAICHEAYEESLAASGINIKQFFGNSDVAYPIVNANIDFFRPVFCSDRLVIHVIPKKLSADKFEVNYEVTIENDIVSRATTKHVCIDTLTRGKRELSDEITAWLKIH